MKLPRLGAAVIINNLASEVPDTVQDAKRSEFNSGNNRVRSRIPQWAKCSGDVSVYFIGLIFGIFWNVDDWGTIYQNSCSHKRPSTSTSMMQNLVSWGQNLLKKLYFSNYAPKWILSFTSPFYIFSADNGASSKVDTGVAKIHRIQLFPFRNHLPWRWKMGTWWIHTRKWHSNWMSWLRNYALCPPFGPSPKWF